MCIATTSTELFRCHLCKCVLNKRTTPSLFIQHTRVHLCICFAVDIDKLNADNVSTDNWWCRLHMKAIGASHMSSVHVTRTKFSLWNRNESKPFDVPNSLFRIEIKITFFTEKRWNEKDFKSVTNREQIFPLVRCHWIATTDANRNIVFGRSFVGFVVGSLLHFCDQNANDTVDAMWTRTVRSLINFSPNKRIKPDYVDVTCTFACTRAFFF